MNIDLDRHLEAGIIKDFKRAVQGYSTDILNQVNAELEVAVNKWFDIVDKTPPPPVIAYAKWRLSKELHLILYDEIRYRNQFEKGITYDEYVDYASNLDQRYNFGLASANPIVFVDDTSDIHTEGYRPKGDGTIPTPPSGGSSVMVGTKC